MADCYVYVGDAQDPQFSLDEGDWENNRPAQLSPDFPSMDTGYNQFFHTWTQSKGLVVKQTDYGAWVALATKEQVLQFIADAYNGKEDLPWVAPALPKVKRFARGLESVRQYALVATEF